MMRVYGVLLALSCGLFWTAGAAAAEAATATQIYNAIGSLGEQTCPVDGGQAKSASAAQDKASYKKPSELTDDERETRRRRYRITSRKNLPSGDYRDRCFDCATRYDEDEIKMLNCLCPVGNGFTRLEVDLDRCDKDAEIAYCEGMLVCGPCLISKNAEQVDPNSEEGKKAKTFLDGIMSGLGKSSAP